jgi:hypothetical protein
MIRSRFIKKFQICTHTPRRHVAVNFFLQKRGTRSKPAGAQLWIQIQQESSSLHPHQPCKRLSRRLRRPLCTRRIWARLGSWRPNFRLWNRARRSRSRIEPETSTNPILTHLSEVIIGEKPSPTLQEGTWFRLWLPGAWDQIASPTSLGYQAEALNSHSKAQAPHAPSMETIALVDVSGSAGIEARTTIAQRGLTWNSSLLADNTLISLILFTFLDSRGSMCSYKP